MSEDLLTALSIRGKKSKKAHFIKKYEEDLDLDQLGIKFAKMALNQNVIKPKKKFRNSALMLRNILREFIENSIAKFGNLNLLKGF